MLAAAKVRDAVMMPPLWKETRTGFELAGLVRDPVFRGEGIPAGDGGPVLLICGFLTGDGSLGTMAGWLKRIGYRPSRAGIRLSVGCTGELVDHLETRLEALVERTGEPAAIVGQSRGGLCALVLAHRRPELVRTVVTLGSPLLDPLDVHPAVAMQARALGVLGSAGVPGLMRVSCRSGACCEEVRSEHAQALAGAREVPVTSVYSRSDGIVRWRSCLVDGARHVEVRASHIGMAFNAQVYRAIGRALPR
jgi:pimeloyl-ACP methyl ester carboxylesterase